MTFTWHITASLDGYIAPPDGSLDWFVPYAGPNPMAAAVTADLGAVLMGHRQYANAIRPEGRIYGGAFSGPVVVLTHADPAEAVDGFTFASGLAEACDRATAAAHGRRVVVMGADTARQCLRAGRLDEIVVHTVPVLLGGGLPMFEDGDGPVSLARMDADLSDNAVNAWYRVQP